MKTWICALALVTCAAAAPAAMAQTEVKTKLPNRPLKQTKEFDLEAIKEGVKATAQAGICTATFVVGVDGLPKKISADCPSPDFVPYVVRAVEASRWDAEIADGYIWQSDPRQQPFKFGTATQVVVDPRGEKPPVLVKQVNEADMERVIQRMKEGDMCNIVFTVGADGVPKDIVPNCSDTSANLPLISAVSRMQYTPAQKGGVPTDWPGLQMPVGIKKKE
jgi:hypothetical protein